MAKPTQENLQERQAWMQQLANDRLRKHDASMQSRKEFTEGAKRVAKENEKYGLKERGEKARNQLRATRGQVAHTKKVMKEKKMEAADDTGMWFLIFSISIIADLITLLPLVGSIASILFSIIIWMVYAFNGYFRTKWGAKALNILGANLLELVPFLGSLPFFTLSAVINYFIYSARKSGISLKNI